VSAREDDRPRQPASPRRKFVIFTLLASPILLVLSAYLFASFGAGRRLQNAIDEADRLDPGWRLGQLIEKRRPPTPDVNSADVVLSMVRIPPRGEDSTATPEDEKAGPPRGEALEALLTEIAPPARLPASVALGLAAELDVRADAIQLGRQLAGLGEGHYKIAYDPFVYNTRLPHAQDARTAARLLQKDAILRADRGDIQGAVHSARAVLGVGRSFGDEPFAISQVVRFACESLGLIAFERALSQGEADAAALAAIQADFAREEKQPLLLDGLRGERAMLFDILDKLSTGEIDSAQIAKATGNPSMGAVSIAAQFGAFSRHNQAVGLKHMNEAVEIAKRPVQEQRALWIRFSSRNVPVGTVSRLINALCLMLEPAGESFANAHMRTRALLRVGEGLAACERFRMAKGRWPKNLDELAPDYLAGPLIDPYDGKPLRLLRTNEGLSLYAMGQDLKDDGGKLHPKGAAIPGFDVGLRLWDVEKRHAPAKELVP
jgi:hypothetical protein